MDRAAADAFLASWLQAWNSHDLEAILDHFADDVVFTSPHAQKMVEGSDGIVRGKTALREYWQEGLRRNPTLHFDSVDLYVGVRTLVINYRNHAGDPGNEVLTFDGPLVVEGHGTYRNS